MGLCVTFQIYALESGFMRHFSDLCVGIRVYASLSRFMRQHPNPASRLKTHPSPSPNQQKQTEHQREAYQKSPADSLFVAERELSYDP
ncbi:hypothetical protein KH172YL63_03730 [Bacillus sp. KH172YL63]|nr:hypothetical protein KH172YL63_03730 [Bacillus sp. KH172YL63]